jgi:hypothetical protein
MGLGPGQGPGDSGKSGRPPVGEDRAHHQVLRTGVRGLLRGLRLLDAAAGGEGGTSALVTRALEDWLDRRAATTRHGPVPRPAQPRDAA